MGNLIQSIFHFHSGKCNKTALISFVACIYEDAIAITIKTNNVDSNTYLLCAPRISVCERRSVEPNMVCARISNITEILGSLLRVRCRLLYVFFSTFVFLAVIHGP